MPENESIRYERDLREQWQRAHERLHEVEKGALALAREIVDLRLKEVDSLRMQVQQLRESSSGVKGGIGALMAAAGIGATIVALLMRLWGK